jgi:hypothetical protein
MPDLRRRVTARESLRHRDALLAAGLREQEGEIAGISFVGPRRRAGLRWYPHDIGSPVRTRLAAGGGSHERTRLCLEIFPAGSEFAGNFARFGISVAFQGPKTYVSPTTYGPNSLDVRAGNFYDVAGN